jgi:long-chain acyl-CoA synthetase
MARAATVLLTSTEANAQAVRSAKSLFDQGIRPGDRVAIVTPEHRFPQPQAAELQAATIAISLGCLRAGVIPVMINPSLTESERRKIVADCRPRKTIVSEEDFRRALAPDSTGPAPELAEVPIGRPMHYTSGTTGAAKGVWTNNLSVAESTLLWAEDRGLWGFNDADRYLLQGPLCHSAPLRFAHATLLVGGSVVLPGWFTAEGTAQALREYAPTVTFTVPTHLHRLLELTNVPAATYRLLAHAGASCPVDLKRRIHDWAGIDRVWEFYGSTEGQFTACSGPEFVSRPGTVGQAREHRSLNIEGGVVWCSAPHYARFRYWGDDRKTAQAIKIGPGGIRFTVGDLGRLDSDGYLFLDGRREDLIITGGVNVYPAEVESILGEHPQVNEIAVFGVDDDRWGQRVEAVYTGSASLSQLDSLARERLAGHKRPKLFHRAAGLPHTTSGKIQHNLLAAFVYEDQGRQDMDPPQSTENGQAEI